MSRKLWFSFKKRLTITNLQQQKQQNTRDNTKNPTTDFAQAASFFALSKRVVMCSGQHQIWCTQRTCSKARWILYQAKSPLKLDRRAGTQCKLPDLRISHVQGWRAETKYHPNCAWKNFHTCNCPMFFFRFFFKFTLDLISWIDYRRRSSCCRNFAALELPWSGRSISS